LAGHKSAWILHAKVAKDAKGNTENNALCPTQVPIQIWGDELGLDEGFRAGLLKSRTRWSWNWNRWRSRFSSLRP